MKIKKIVSVCLVVVLTVSLAMPLSATNSVGDYNRQMSGYTLEEVLEQLNADFVDAANVRSPFIHSIFNAGCCADVDCGLVDIEPHNILCWFGHSWGTTWTRWSHWDTTHHRTLCGQGDFCTAHFERFRDCTRNNCDEFERETDDRRIRCN